MLFSGSKGYLGMVTHTVEPCPVSRAVVVTCHVGYRTRINRWFVPICFTWNQTCSIYTYRMGAFCMTSIFRTPDPFDCPRCVK
jgi:hypothetical protein